MRVKEGSDDYRYFPEPDLPTLDISDDWINEIQVEMPEMPGKRRERYINDLGLTDYDAMVITQTKEMSDFFDATVKLGADAKMTANYLQGDVNAYLNEQHADLQDTDLTPENLAGMINLINDGTILRRWLRKSSRRLLRVRNQRPLLKKRAWFNYLTQPNYSQLSMRSWPTTSNPLKTSTMGRTVPLVSWLVKS